MDIQINPMDYEHLESEAMAERLSAITTLTRPDIKQLVSNEAGRRKAVEILMAHDRTQKRKKRISLNRERLRSSALG